MASSSSTARTILEELLWLFSLNMDAFLQSIDLERVTMERFMRRGWWLRP